ncbi:MAG: hypothetical protein JWN34_597 [Bryobacterales bacterium]|nr:hypothetical protein [Bryobacterales bacterium]
MLVPRRAVRSLCLAVLVTTCPLAPVQTSAKRGNLGGMVSDAPRGLLPGAREITSDATALSLETTTNPEGLYEFAALEPDRGPATWNSTA